MTDLELKTKELHSHLVLRPFVRIPHFPPSTYLAGVRRFSTINVNNTPFLGPIAE